MSVFWFSISTNDQQSFKCSLILKHCDDSSFPGVSRTNSCNNQFPVCLRGKLVRALQRYILRRSGLEEWSFFAEIFSGFLLLVMFSSEMIFSTFSYFFIPQLKYMKFIYSFYHQDDASIFKCSYFNICTKKVNIKYYYTLI